jgi:hypothetical protein
LLGLKGGFKPGGKEFWRDARGSADFRLQINQSRRHCSDVGIVIGITAAEGKDAFLQPGNSRTLDQFVGKVNQFFFPGARRKIRVAEGKKGMAAGDLGQSWLLQIMQDHSGEFSMSDALCGCAPECFEFGEVVQESAAVGENGIDGKAVSAQP